MKANKYLILSFKSANLFKSHKATKDRVSVYGDESKNRTDYNIKGFVEPITKYQISGLLHILTGQIPVSTIKQINGIKNVHDRVEWVESMVDRVYIKYNTPTLKISKNKHGYINETIRVNKSAFNSYNNTVNVTWNDMANYTGEAYGEILDIFKKYNLDVNQPLNRLVDIIHNHLDFYNDFISEISNVKGCKSAYWLYLNNKYTLFKDSKANRRGSSYTYSNGIDNKQQFQGELIVEVTDDELNIIKNNYKGCATILDGGVVNVVAVEDYIPIEYIKNFTPINDISLETY